MDLESREIVLCSKNKGTVTAQLICVFVFAYVKSRFSHDTAHIIEQDEEQSCLTLGAALVSW